MSFRDADCMRVETTLGQRGHLKAHIYFHFMSKVGLELSENDPISPDLDSHAFWFQSKKILNGPRVGTEFRGPIQIFQLDPGCRFSYLSFTSQTESSTKVYGLFQVSWVWVNMGQNGPFLNFIFITARDI